MFTLKELKKSTTPTRIKPGIYVAKVTAVQDDERYVSGDAFVVTYDLSAASGTHVGKFVETFFNRRGNPRTMELVELMEQLDIEEVDSLVGTTFEVEIRYRVTKQGGSLPSIVSRTPISPPGDDIDTPPEEVK